MRIVLLASGSRGDVQPYVALGVGLKKKGYEVCVATAENFKDYVASYGLNFLALHRDISQVMDRAEIEVQMKARKPISFILSFNKVNEDFRKELNEAQEKAWEACEDADAIVFHPGLMNGYYFSKKLGIPGILASPIPFSPTSEYPAIIFYNSPRLGGWFNRISHSVFNQVFWGSIKPSVVALWKKHDPSLRVKNPLTLIHKEELLLLYSISGHVVPPAHDWNDSIKVTGYWFPNVNSWRPSERLTEFLESDSDPVYIGFGSIRGKEAETNLKTAVEALLQLEKRVIITSSGFDEGWFDDSNIFFLKNAPHTWLFPRMSMVVHHGGAGTTAAGLASGKPSVIVPHSNDQPMWAKRVKELGVGTMVKAGRGKISVERFAQVFKEMEKETVVKKASEMGDLIRKEDGVNQAIEYIEKYIRARYSE